MNDADEPLRPWQMVPERLPVDVVVNHPALAELGRDPYDQRRAEAFAKDLARWLFGRPARELAPLARVITVIAGRELRWTRRMCQDRPLLAVEAAARSTAALWPWIRGNDSTGNDPEPPPDAEDEPATGAGGAEDGEDEDETTGAAEDETAAPDEGEDGDGDGEEDDPGESWLARLGEEAEDDGDPDLEALIERLQAMGADGDEADASEAAAEALSDVSDAASEGASEVDEVARQLEQFLPGVGWSSAPGQLEAVLLDRLDQLAALLGQLPQLQELADQLGRVEEAGERRGTSDGGSEEVVGVRFGGDVRTALPCELGLLGDVGTEDLFYQRFAERQLVSLELAGQGLEGVAEGTKRGPIIAAIDTSASMEGPPELAAKALVLAVCRVAVPRGRAVHLLLFGGPGEQTELRVVRGLGGLEAILAFLQQRFRSGTDFDGPLLRALELLDERDLDRADILVVTDGLCRAAPEVVKKVADSRARRGVKVWSVLLGTQDDRGVAPFSDEVVRVDPDRPEADVLWDGLGKR